MRQIARSMRAELDKLQSGASGHPTTVGTIGAWDVPTELGKRVDAAHESMITYVTEFAKLYEALIRRIETSARDFDLSDLASRDAAERAGRPLDPRVTRESQN
ncbi:hypothetical protein [Actinomadura sp. 9N407]|uniref:hypothetical protein n=1 Tax=Actinomadura sp. 9N407 TaxID=3375154 RepID=UPI0037A26787